MFSSQGISFTNGRATTMTATPNLIGPGGIQPILGPGGIQPILGPGGIQQCPGKKPSTLLSDVSKCLESYNPASNVADASKVSSLVGCMVKVIINDHLVQTGVKASTSS